MNARPFFSEIDSELLKQGSVRDYLGLVPVWSKIARKLEPNLSGAIGSYRGLEAVLFIYYLPRIYNHRSECPTFLGKVDQNWGKTVLCYYMKSDMSKILF